ncbi:translation initiation factor eIF-2B epsilon subunit, GEF [Coemansia sp. BCRC 34301]|nr:translation initiation factor eIF-2B epsilon subunit, GEF [Coemansia sp. BCRC 34301]
MPPKKPIATKFSEEKDLKAVVLADSFDDLFHPLTLDKPRCLLPLCNVPMIEYTLEFLAASGVVETILVCKAHSEKLLAYIRQSKWSRGSTPMKVNTTIAQSAMSVCDALRKIDESSVILSDFILCTGLVVSNMDLSKLVAVHLANKDHEKKRERNLLMTMLLREAASTHRLYDKSDESVYLIDPSTSRLLAVNSSSSLPRAGTVNIPTKAITKNPELELRADLIDTHVSICSPDVLAQLTENFDYQVVRRDFIHRTLISDLVPMSIYAHILTGSSSGLPEVVTASAVDALAPALGALDLSPSGSSTFASHSGYAAGVADTAAYDAISRDLIGRWAYPLCPDSNPTDGPPYSYHRGAVYKTPTVFLGRESRVDHHVILGPNSHVADHARVFDSVLGSDCHISGQSVVCGSYLFDRASVGKGSVVERSILGERVMILENVVVERGCLIGDDVILGPNVRIPAFSRISRRAPQDRHAQASDASDSDSDSDLDGADLASSGGLAKAGRTSTNGQPGLTNNADTEVFETQALGSSGAGYVLSDDEEGDSDFEDDAAASKETGARTRIIRSIGSNVNDLERANAELAAEASMKHAKVQAEDTIVRSPQEEFEDELILITKEVLEGSEDIDKAMLDLSRCRMSCNADQNVIRHIVLKEALDAIDLAALPGSAKATLARVSKLVTWGISTGTEQLDAIGIVERYCALNQAVDDSVCRRLFKAVVCILYELDVLEDMAVIVWYNRSLERSDGEVSRALLGAIKPFVDVLNESDDDSSSDE